MKLTEKNARFAVVKTAFHGGGVISYHNSIEEALKADKKFSSGGCICGCCRVIPITEEAREELVEQGYCSPREDLFQEIPYYTGNEFSPYTICK